MIKPLKEWLKNKLKKGLAIPDLERQIQQLQQETEMLRPYVVTPWYQENLWEPAVQIALRDLCRSGDVVFDVGANFGGLSLIMSRCVGPKGIVCAFEASPRIVDKCQRNLVLNGCNNVQVYHAAVHYQSYEQVPIYYKSHLNDSIYPSHQTGEVSHYVPTIALDDFIKQTGLIPNLIKMDIEDAEFDALKGMINTLENQKPHLILEAHREDTRCLDFLREKGYTAIDVNRYREVKSSDDYPLKATIRNNLYIHQDRLSEVVYRPPFTFLETTQLSAEDFNKKGNKITLKQTLTLEAGRYLVDVDFTAQGRDNELVCGVRTDHKLLMQYHGYSQLLADSYRDWVIHVPQRTSVNIYFQFLGDTSDPTLSINGAKILRIAEFDALEPYLPIIN